MNTKHNAHTLDACTYAHSTYYMYVCMYAHSLCTFYAHSNVCLAYCCRLSRCLVAASDRHSECLVAKTWYQTRNTSLTPLERAATSLLDNVSENSVIQSLILCVCVCVRHILTRRRTQRPPIAMVTIPSVCAWLNGIPPHICSFAVFCKAGAPQCYPEVPGGSSHRSNLC